MFMKSRRQNSKKGFTLTEAAIVLGIVGLILGAIWVAAGSVYRNMRVATTTDQLLQITQAIRSLHATQPQLDTALSVVNIAKAGGVPKDMLDDITNPTVVTDVWGGAVTITRVNNTQFRISLAGVPADACADLLTRNTGSGRDTGLISAGSDVGGELGPNEMPIMVSAAVTNCGNAPSTVSFTFALRS